MAIKVEKSGDGQIATIEFSGSLTFDEWASLRANHPRRGDCSRVYLDLRELKHIDTAGVGMLLWLADRLEKDRKEVVVLPCNPRIGNFLNVVGLERWLTIPPGCSPRSSCTGVCFSKEGWVRSGVVSRPDGSDRSTHEELATLMIRGGGWLRECEPPNREMAEGNP